MNRLTLPLLLCLALTLACTSVTLPTDLPTAQPLPTSSLPPLLTAVSERRCGDGVCDGPETAATCPADCPGGAPAASPTPGKEGPGVGYTVTNPTSGAQLYVQAFYPQGQSSANPALVLVPGGTGLVDLQKAQRLSAEGFVVIVFDPDGRGRSTGTEDLGGYAQQDGLAAVIQFAATLPGVDPAKIGLVSYSYGVTMATGALVRHPDLPIRFLIDWEGPADRYDTTTDCQPKTGADWPACTDDAAWAQREALTFIAQVRVPYQRIQSAQDHVQPDVTHALAMINAAQQGGVPWTRLNDGAANQTYDLNYPPVMLPEAQDKQIEALVAKYARELFNLA
jgi:pimeloyl-ACP methyl ester carboxylesterase